VRVTLINRLPAATTIHWHGVRVPNAEDGVAGITQDAVPAGGTYTYDFVAKDAGTFWYHSHQDTFQQVPRGLFGALVVEPRGGHVAEVRDYAVVLDRALGGDPRLAAAPGETVRLRLIEATSPPMNGQPDTFVLIGAPYRVVALDSGEIHGPQLLGPERLQLGMGQRADVVFTVPASGGVRLQGLAAATGSSVTIGAGLVPRPANLDGTPRFDPTRYGTPAPDALSGPADGTFPLRLSEQGGFRDGRPELIHMINGQASPDVPAITVRDGERVRLHIVNETGEYHPMHLHGHRLSLLTVDGRRIEGSPILVDTVLVAPHQTWDVAFLADNPGIWMLHCHVLIHAAFGMSMTVNYEGISTPFVMGGPAGNVPE
jgi:FtsP/CotA-like multicopper oxidase with cupredoxin domain